MNGRYDNIATKKTADGRTVYKTSRYPNIPLKNSDIYVATETGDRFDSLANQFYSNPSLWWIIASANNIHDGSMAVEDGTVLRIPVQYLEIVNNFTENINK
jgi:hypothetical protein